MRTVLTSDLRRMNREVVLRATAQMGEASRQELALATSLTGAAISRITRELLDAGLLTESAARSETARGRRTHPLRLAADGAFMVAMVISANRRAVAVFNACGGLVDQIDLDELPLNPAANALRVFAEQANRLIKRSDIERSRVLGISVVVAANNNPGPGGCVTSPVLGWIDIPIAQTISTLCDLPVHLEARAVALLQSELWQSDLNDNTTAVLVNNGWRMGSSVFVGGRLLETATARLGQLAHYSLPNQRCRCHCGQSGCLDALASGEAIVGVIDREAPNVLPVDMPVTLKLDAAIKLADTHAICGKAFFDAGVHLGTALVGIQTLFAPERIFLAGATSRQPQFVKGVNEGFIRPDPAMPAASVCAISSIEAAMRSGLENFLFSNRLNLRQFGNPFVQLAQ